MLFLGLIIGGSCKKETPTEPVIKPDTTHIDTSTATETYGAFQIMLTTDKQTSMLGKIYDGPTPPVEIYTEIMKSGPCKLYKRVHPYCEDCGSSASCIAEDSCQPYSKAINIGTITVNGLKLANGKTSFTMDPINYYYQPMADDRIAYPPCNEGDVATLSASGSAQLAAFTLNFKGITALKVLNDTNQVPFPDHQAITLNWVPPATTGNSKIFVQVDISYHGGTQAKIEANCEDNGSLTIPAQMLDSLKTFGISGFPRIQISRRALSVNATAKVKITMESLVTLWLAIPGVISCNSDAQCPEGQACAGDQRCRPK
jgi:hypothetical protein